MMDCFKYIDTFDSYVKTLSDRFPVCLVQTDKYDTTFYLINSGEDLERVSLHIIKQNRDMDFYDGSELRVANIIINSNAGKTAFGFLKSRSKYEYENIKIEYFQKVS
jgi:hypothetical protein